MHLKEKEYLLQVPHEESEKPLHLNWQRQVAILLLLIVNLT